MNGILGFVKLLKESKPTQEQADYLYTIEQSADNLLRIINDVLDFSKIEAGKLSINNLNFNLEECIEDVLALISPSAHDKGIEIATLFYNDTPKELFGAADRIRQILINLIGNAIKFSSAGTIMIRTMLESRNNELLKIKITVTDQGPGISEKDTKKLFNSFSQIDESDTRQYGGAGLGLAISKSLSEAMHGNIGVESRKNIGSTFWFTFECQYKTAVDFIDETRSLPYENKSVRLYDANEITRLSLSHSFQHLGFSVIECLSIEELHITKNTPKATDLYILSLNRKDATSIEVKEFLTAHKNNTDSKMLTIISSSDTLAINSLCNWGADACLTKPFRHFDLEKKLAAIFKNVREVSTKKPYINIDSESQTRLDGLNILVAEDNAINSKLVETILLQSGAATNVVDNGGKAVAEFQKSDFDIILMDIHMPIMNGIDAARKIRECENPASLSRIPILGLTAISKNKDEEIFRNTDFNEILEKPISVDELLHEIAYWTHVRNAPAINDKANRKSSDNHGIDKDLSTTLNEMLLRELPIARGNLQTAFDSNDYRYLRGEIHRLLGGMAYCNFTELQRLTLQYQSSLKANNSDMQDDFQKMLAEIERLTASGKI